MNKITVEIIFASVDTQHFWEIDLPPGASILDALKRINIFTLYPELLRHDLPVGIFNKKVPLETALRHGDRVEVYRPLVIDPKTARRKRAKK